MDTQIFNNPIFLGVIFIIIGFFSGTVPYGMIYSTLRGVDIRKVGSGNIGATNVARQFGFWQGLVPIAILDIVKGLLPVLFFRIATHYSPTMINNVFEILIGMAAIMGHIFSPFLGGKGGKGVATAAGALIAWNPLVAGILFCCFLLVFFTIGQKIIGRASVVSVSLFPFLAFLLPGSTLPFKIISIVIAVLVIYTHRNNIKEWQTGEDLAKKKAKSKQ